MLRFMRQKSYCTVKIAYYLQLLTQHRANKLPLINLMGDQAGQIIYIPRTVRWHIIFSNDEIRY